MSRHSEPAPPFDPRELDLFENELDPARPAQPPTGAELVGFGEISMVFRLDAYPGRVFKRVAGLSSREATAYRQVVAAYVARLEGCGVQVADVNVVEVEREHGGTITYLSQRAMQPARLANQAALTASDEQFETLLVTVLAHVDAVLKRGAGLDAQLSNWALEAPGEFDRLTYLDLTTPMLRTFGRERLDLGFVLRSLPLPLRLVMKLVRADRTIMDRYYCRRSAALDVVSNLIKEGMERRLPLAIRVVNIWLRAGGDRSITLEEVRADYRNDARMWAFLQWVRRPDRWLRLRFGGSYDWGLAPRIDRRNA